MLTRFAFTFQRLVFFIVIVLMAFGVYSYFTLPAQEDPHITIRAAVVTTSYPGLSPERVEQLITKPLERAIRRMPEVEEIRSSSLVGTSIIHVEVFDRYFDLDQIWDDLRTEIARARTALPEGTGPPMVADDVGNVAVVTAALRSPDHSLTELGDMANHIRDQLYGEPGVKSVDIAGQKPERIYIETRNARLASLGIAPDLIARTLADQNIIRPGGQIDLGQRSFVIEPTGDYADLEAIRETLITLPDGTALPLRDIADVVRDVVDPAPQAAYYNGDPAIIFAVAMQEGENVLEFGPRIRERLADIESGLPLGMTLDIVTFQAEQVERAVYGVSLSVLQTLGIVLGVVVFMLGLRTGLIVGAIIPAVMLATLALMGFLGLPLERMSLATLVIALGLLVDAGVVVAEDFKARLSQGETRDAALVAVGRYLTLPLLSSTATIILAFLPLMLAEHVAGEYTRSISIVIAIMLSISWLLAMTITPVLSHRFAAAQLDGDRPYYERMFDPLLRIYGSTIALALKARWIVVGLMAGGLVVGVALVATSPQKFFPDSDRPQLIVYIYLPADVTTRETEREIAELLPTLTPARFDWLQNHVAYVGFGGPRFVLSLTPVDPAPNRAVLILNVDDPTNVDRAMDELRGHFNDRFGHLSAQVTRMFLGPSDSSVLEVQVRGPDRDFVYETADRVAGIIGTVPGARDIRQNWENRVPRIVVDVDQIRARAAGVSSADVARALSAHFSGRAVSEFREGEDTIPIIARAIDAERNDLNRVRSLSVVGGSGAVVPLLQVADVRLETGFARIERQDLTRAVTVQGRSELMGAEDMVSLIASDLDALRAELPPGHSIELDGIVVQSAEGRAALAANMPLVLAIIVILLIAQFNSFRRPAIILTTIPLIVLGAGLGLRLFGADFGFMPILGLLSLAGIILINGIVLIDRIDIERRQGRAVDDAIIEAAKRRLRPILITTTTTILGLLPLIVSRDPLFYGMAVVMASGLAVGTFLTLGFVPVLYSLFFDWKSKSEAAAPAAATPHHQEGATS